MSRIAFERLPPRMRQLAWFVGLWVGSVATLAVVALAIRWVLVP
ncbi:DUF2474 family protein [Aureimonas sp. N4]|nr:DUF2474 family protein [Aureimonas sp. N4]